MAVTNYLQLLQHVGHDVEIATYGAEHLGHSAPANIAIECLTCSTVLIDFDNPEIVERQRQEMAAQYAPDTPLPPMQPRKENPMARTIEITDEQAADLDRGDAITIVPEPEKSIHDAVAQCDRVRTLLFEAAKATDSGEAFSLLRRTPVFMQKVTHAVDDALQAIIDKGRARDDHEHVGTWHPTSSYATFVSANPGDVFAAHDADGNAIHIDLSTFDNQRVAVLGYGTVLGPEDNAGTRLYDVTAPNGTSFEAWDSELTEMHVERATPENDEAMQEEAERTLERDPVPTPEALPCAECGKNIEPGDEIFIDPQKGRTAGENMPWAEPFHPGCAPNEPEEQGAFQTYLGHEPPDELKQAWLDFQVGDGPDPATLTKLDEWRADVDREVAEYGRPEERNVPHIWDLDYDGDEEHHGMSEEQANKLLASGDIYLQTIVRQYGVLPTADLSRINTELDL